MGPLIHAPGTPANESRLLRPLTTADLGALNVFVQQPTRLGSTVRYWTAGFHEKGSKDDGTFEWKTDIHRRSKTASSKVRIYLNSTPFAQQPRPECKSKGDWDHSILRSLLAILCPVPTIND